ncbi:M16 family metallopeptidase [Vibrio sp. TBV020]|uniref:M16 family metallopeptidase n=1 Tax=Vibrio sp. TBV020 TaxID=3137398 RepID=UPI0038CDAF67
MKKLFFVILLVLVGCSQPKQDISIETDSGWTSGQLENGLKYHIYPNDKEAVAIRMYVHVGSAHETEEQKGYAHFLEHMAFNGSRNFSSNDIVHLFEHSGLTFGADINAYTSYYETVYKLDLPNPKELSNGVKWMRDIADGLNLSSDEIEKEKGVIQGEFRRTRPENKSLSEKYYDHLIQGTELESLDPLGTKESVNNATTASIRAFYETWYHPQLTEVIITGDIAPEETKALLEENFANWKGGETPKGSEIARTTLDLTDFTEEIGEFDFPSISVLLDQSPSSIVTRQDLYDFWMDDVIQQLIWARIDEKLNQTAQPVQSLYSSSYYINYRRYSLLSVSFTEEERSKVQSLFTETFASLRDHGVTELELEASMAYYTQLLKTVDEQWKQRTAVDIAESKVNAISLDEPLQSKEDYRQSLETFIEYATFDRVNEQLTHFLKQDYVLILGAEQTDSIEALSKTIPSVRKQLGQAGVKPLALESKQDELSRPDGKGAIVNERTLDNGFTVWQLSNGIEVWFEPDENAGERVRLVYGSQGGKAALDPRLFAASELSIATISRSGIGEFNGTELDSYLRRNNIEVYPFIGFTDHGLEIGAPRDKLSEALSVLFNITTNVNVEKRQLAAVSRETIEGMNNYLDTPVGKWSREINRNSYLPDSFHYMLPAPEFSMVDEGQVKEVHKQLFTVKRSNKLVVIADLKPEQIREMLRFYIASIPLENAPSYTFDARYNLDPKPRIDLAIFNEPNTYYMVRVTNPDAKPSDVESVFIDDMIQRHLSKRLTEYIREDLGLDYAPDNYVTSQDGEPSIDWFIEAQVAPSDIDKVDAAVDKILNELLQGVAQEDVDLVAKQLAVALHPLADDTVQRAWFYARYLMHGYGVEALTDIDAMTQSITKDAFNERVQLIFGEQSIKTKYALTPEK